MKWYDAPIVVIDFESTGFKKPACIIEVGAVRFEGGRVVDELELLIRPFSRIEKSASEVHGLWDGDVCDQPPFEQRYPILRDFFAGAIPASYGDFDRRMLHTELARLQQRRVLAIDYQVPAFSPQWGPWLDILRWAREMYPIRGKGKHKLEAVCEREEIEIREAHRAIDDAWAAAQLLWKWHDDGWLPDCGIVDMLAQP